MYTTRCRFGARILVILSLSALASLAQSGSAKRTLHLDGGPNYFKVWLDQDVRWIISDEERAAFKMLQNDEERDSFVEAFWLRRNPTPDSPQNPYKVEHYHRIAYANEQFGVLGKPGWSTDRGRIYIMYGQPDQIEPYPKGKPKAQVSEHENTPVKESFRAAEDRSVPPGEDLSLLPLEVWRYRYLEGVGQDVELAFIDVCGCSDYRLQIEPALRDTFSVPSGLTGLPTVRREPGDYRPFIAPPQSPPIKFPDLLASVGGKIILNPFPFEVRSDFVKATDVTSLVFLTIAIPHRDLKFVEKPNSRHATLNIFGRLSTLTGHITDEFEETVEINESSDSGSEDKTLRVIALALRGSRYKLEIAVKDVTADRKGTWSRALLVPEYDHANLSTSTLALAEKVAPVTRDVDTDGFFRAGSSYVRPYTGSSPGEFRVPRGGSATAWMQVYGLASDAHTHKPSVSIDYDIFNRATGAVVFHEHSPATSTERLPSDVMTVRNSLPTAELHTGTYRLDIRVEDEVSKVTVKQSADFMIE